MSEERERRSIKHKPSLLFLKSAWLYSWLLRLLVDVEIRFQVLLLLPASHDTISPKDWTVLANSRRDDSVFVVLFFCFHQLSPVSAPKQCRCDVTCLVVFSFTSNTHTQSGCEAAPPGRDLSHLLGNNVDSRLLSGWSSLGESMVKKTEVQRSPENWNSWGNLYLVVVVVSCGKIVLNLKMNKLKFGPKPLKINSFWIVINKHQKAKR